MSEIKITNLVDEATIESIKELNAEMKALVATYSETAKGLAQGLKIDVKLVGDVDKLERLYIEKSKEAAVTTGRLNTVIAQQGQAIASTTNTISRQLMEQERVNKSQRESYTTHEKVKQLLDQFHDTYSGQLERLTRINLELELNKKAQSENKKALSENRMTMDAYAAAQGELIAQHRSLTQEKRTLTQIMTAEEKAAQSQEGSYVHMSQQLELLKKAYKDLNDEGRNSDFGKELETAIQDLDAHLKDMAADMGEFQRNVGNYAIAGQNGVVTTESIIAAMNQEARTTQDVIDQTKILEDAKRMLNTEDANYQMTLEAVNAKIDENKRRLTDVSDILGKQATSVAEAEAQNKRLSEALKNVDQTSADAKARMAELRAQIDANNKMIAEATGANEKFADSMLSLIGVNTNFGSSMQSLGQSGNVLDGLHTKVQAFGQTLMGILANPWVLAFLGIAGFAAGFKWWYDFNKGLIEASRLTENFTGLTGEAADKITADLGTVADHMGKSFDSTIGAANTLVQQFGISWDDALTKIKDGIEAGADMNGRFVENINQFAPALRDAGVSVDEFVSILAETRNGIFDEKGVQDIVKGGTKLRAMTKQVADSLDACGISSKQMQEDLKNGNMTMLEAVQQVASKLKELPENSQEAGQVMKNVFGRTAAEGGTLLIQSIADVNTNLDVAKERMGELGKVNREQMEAQQKLNETLTALFKMGGTSFEEMTIKSKTFIAQGLTKIIGKCVDIANWFIRIYNNSESVRAKIETLGMFFKVLWSIVRNVCSAIADEFKGVGQILEGLFSMDPKLISQGVETVKNGYKDAAKGIADDFVEAFKTAKDRVENNRLNEIKLELEADPTAGARANEPKKTATNDDNGHELTDKEKKEAEKRAKEELKRIHELEESKIAAMAEGHDKELAMIRQKFKKKIDEITGNGETENALRLQLAEQCEKEIADCELKYQQQLAKINLENRLAAVKTGSKEELDLKMAQIEANRAAEIEAAEKTGADVNLINEKFNRRREDLEADYAARRAQQIQQQYADEEDARNNSYLAQVNALKQRYAEELAQASGNAAKQEAIKRNLEREMYQLEVDYAQQAAQASIEMIEEILNLENLSVEERQKWEKLLAKAKIDLAQQVADANKESVEQQIEDEETLRNKRLASVQQWLQVASDALNAVSGLVGTVYDAKIQKIEEEQEANSAAGEAEIERITELVDKKVITEEEGEARKRAAEAQTAKKNEELEKKKQQLQYKQAVWDKANSIAQAGIATALAITKALPNVALAAIAGAMGAIQVATILATPIPKYAKGTDYHRGGLAIVGDGGHSEVVVFDGSAWITPDTPTLVDMPRGATVLPSIAEYNDTMSDLVMISERGKDTSPVIVNNDYSRLERIMGTMVSLIRAQNRIQSRMAYGRTTNYFLTNIA